MSKPAAKKVAVKPVAKKVADAKVVASKLAKEITKAHLPIIHRADKSSEVKPKVEPKSKAEAKPALKKSVGDSKADKARAIYERMSNKPRKDVLLAFVTEAGLTVAGAATYYSNIKKGSTKA